MKYVPWALLCLALFLGWTWHERNVGALTQRIAQLEQHVTQVDTIYTHDTLTLTKVRERVNKILMTDTLIKTDTVKILITAERLACNQVVQTCEQRVAVRDSLIKELKKKPSVFSKLPWVVAGAVAWEVLR